MLRELLEPKQALITGVCGFAGHHLSALLLAETAWNVIGVDRRSGFSTQPERCRFVVADLTEPGKARRVLAEAQPDYVFHLAAATPPVPDDELMRANLVGAVLLLEAVATVCPKARVLVVGSDAEYGPQNASHLPTNEGAPLRPVGVYGRSKVLQERIARTYGRMCGLSVICVRPFNYIGPGQSEHFVVPALARQIALAELGLGPSVVELGRTDTARDFTDARDVAHAFLLSVVRGRPGAVYNIGSGTPRGIENIAQRLAACARVPITFHSDTRTDACRRGDDNAVRRVAFAPPNRMGATHSDRPECGGHTE